MTGRFICWDGGIGRRRKVRRGYSYAETNEAYKLVEVGCLIL